MMPRMATPPTTPPMIAPTLVRDPGALLGWRPVESAAMVLLGTLRDDVLSLPAASSHLTGFHNLRECEVREHPTECRARREGSVMVMLWKRSE